MNSAQLQKSSPNLPSGAESVDPLVRIEERNADNSLLCEAWLENGVLQGPMTAYDDNQTIRVKSNYQEGELSGSRSVFDENGNLAHKSTYEETGQTGITRIYSGGVLVAEQEFKHGLLNGKSITFNQAGEITSEQLYVGGVLEGASLFYMNSQVIRKEKYVNGLLEGDRCDYDRDGRIVQSAQYHEGLLHGWVTQYWPNGTKMELRQFKLGKLVGAPQRFNSKGQEESNPDERLTFSQRIEKLVKG